MPKLEFPPAKTIKAFLPGHSPPTTVFPWQVVPKQMFLGERLSRVGEQDMNPFLFPFLPLLQWGPLPHASFFNAPEWDLSPISHSPSALSLPSVNSKEQCQYTKTIKEFQVSRSSIPPCLLGGERKAKGVVYLKFCKMHRGFRLGWYGRRKSPGHESGLWAAGLFLLTLARVLEGVWCPTSVRQYWDTLWCDQGAPSVSRGQASNYEKVLVVFIYE